MASDRENPFAPILLMVGYLDITIPLQARRVGL